MSEIAIADVVITPRQRKEIDLDHIHNLAASIEKFGLLHPISLNKEDNTLVAGFTRIQAYMHLGRTTIPFRYVEELTPVERKELELEENVRRKQLEWYEEANAIAEIDRMRREADPEWTKTKTAALVGKSNAYVTKATQLDAAIKEDPSIKEEKTLRSAIQRVDTQRKLEKRKREIEHRVAGLLPTIRAQIHVGDCRDLIKNVADSTVDAIITNLPFGVDYELKGGGQVYEDEETFICDLVREIIPECFRILKDDSWMIAFFDVRKITYSNAARRALKDYIDRLTHAPEPIVKNAERAKGLAWWMEDAGFSWVSLVPAIWVKPNKRMGILGDPAKGMITAYEACVFAAKGKPTLLKTGKQNIFIYDTLNPSERMFEMQMNQELCAYLVSLVSFGGGIICDPFAGSGSIGLGALDNQCEFIGFELDADRASLGNTLLREHKYAFGSNEDESN